MVISRIQNIVIPGVLGVSLLLVQSLVLASLLPEYLPNIQNSTVSVSSSLNATNEQFVYSYSVKNDVSNVGSIVAVYLYFNTDLDLLPSVELELKKGWGDTSSIGEVYANWVASAGYKINPGDAPSVFKLTSQFPPGILKFALRPSWHDYKLYPSHEFSKQELREFVTAREALNKYVETLGPVGVKLGSDMHWNQFRDDLNMSIELGWIHDGELASNLMGQLTSAREALDAGNDSLANSRLQKLIKIITTSVEDQRSIEAHDLVLLNCQSLIRK